VVGGSFASTARSSDAEIVDLSCLEEESAMHASTGHNKEAPTLQPVAEPPCRPVLALDLSALRRGAEGGGGGGPARFRMDTSDSMTSTADRRSSLANRYDALGAAEFHRLDEAPSATPPATPQNSTASRPASRCRRPSRVQAATSSTPRTAITPRRAMEPQAAASMTPRTATTPTKATEPEAATSMTPRTATTPRKGMEPQVAASVTPRTANTPRMGIEPQAAVSLTPRVVTTPRMGMEPQAATSLTPRVATTPRKQVALDLRSLRDDTLGGAGGDPTPPLSARLTPGRDALPSLRTPEVAACVAATESQAAEEPRHPLSPICASVDRSPLHRPSWEAMPRREDTRLTTSTDSEGMRPSGVSLDLGFLYEKSPSSRSRAASVAGVGAMAAGLLDEHGEVDLRNLKRATLEGHRSTVASLAPAIEEHRACSYGQPWDPWRSAEGGCAPPETQGPLYSQWVWAYYCNSGAWSDGLCAVLQHGDLMCTLLCPPLWLRRLYLTLWRASPLDVRILGHGCRVTQDRAWAVAAGAFALLLLGYGLGLLCAWLLLLSASRGRLAQVVAALALLWPPSFLGALLWAQLLTDVGQKYSITQVQRSPLAFLLKASCCLSVMNVRVGLHVDRAQGFMKPSRTVRDMVLLSTGVGAAARSTIASLGPPRQAVELGALPRNAANPFLA